MSRRDVHDVYRKSIFIADELRNKIVKGVYQPGDRLPSRDELVSHYRVSKATVQRAFEQLKADGFAVAKVGSGTIVSITSPHLTRYALLFPQELEATHHNQLWVAMAREATALVEECNVDLHYGFQGHDGISRYQSLLDDVQHHRLAGLIFASPPDPQLDAHLLREPRLPRVALMSPHPNNHVSCVDMDQSGLIVKIAQSVVKNDCRRVALIVSDQVPMKVVRQTQQTLKRLGVPIQQEWVHGVSNVQPAWGGALTRILMAGSPKIRPDCIIVLDDNLLPPISDALKELNLMPPRDLQLIAHCNFPWPSASAVPAIRVGFCITACLKNLVQLLDDQRKGDTTSRCIRLPVYLDSEYPHPIKCTVTKKT